MIINQELSIKNINLILFLKVVPYIRSN
jgi:hypothetical protein